MVEVNLCYDGMVWCLIQFDIVGWEELDYVENYPAETSLMESWTTMTTSLMYTYTLPLGCKGHQNIVFCYN